MIALDTAGNILWATTTQAEVFDSPTVAGKVVYAGSKDGDLYAINAASGLIKWHKHYETPAQPVDYSPAYVNGILYFTEGYYVRAVKASNGERVWAYKLHFGPNGYDPAGVAVAAGHVYFGCTCGEATALNATTGAQEWQNFIQSTNQPLTVANGLLFVPGSGGRSLYAVDASSGTPTSWHVDEGPPLSGSDAWTAPAISDGVVYAGATDGKLYAFKP